MNRFMNCSSHHVLISDKQKFHTNTEVLTKLKQYWEIYLLNLSGGDEKVFYIVYGYVMVKKRERPFLAICCN